VSEGAGWGAVMGKLALAGDAEGARVPAGLRLFDAHVHLFPERVFEAIWRWFGQHAWPIRYRLHAEQVVEFLSARGVSRMTALVYAHKPGMAEALNDFVAELGRAHACVAPLGTVMPGEPDAARIVRRALDDLGLRGIKLHCHVQRLAADDPRLDEVYATAAEIGRPVVIHAGREPSSAAYGLDTRALCAAEQIDRVLQRHPKLKLVVPHLGADEYDAYAALLERHEHLWLDTTMAVAGYLPGPPPTELVRRHADRLLYGTDFPNIPYAWDRELQRLLALPLTEAQRAKLFWGNACALFGA
jgi:predicted TIM-barrel fold metal-dependent hydrolase